MSDTRFIILGLVLVFVGFLVLGLFGGKFLQFTIQENEFGDCFDFKDGVAVRVNCDTIAQNKIILFSIVLAMIAGGIFVLIKGVRGRWDQNVKSDEMVGPKSGP